MSAEPTPLEGHELFVAVLAQIEREPHLWDQQTYACGSSHCFAGWAILLAGGRFLDVDAEEAVMPGGRSGHAAAIAGPLLGIGYDDTIAYGPNRLFSSQNSLADLYRISADRMGIDEATLRDEARSVVAGSDLTA